MHDIPARTHCVYIVCVRTSEAISIRIADGQFAMRNVVPITYKNPGTNSVYSSCKRAIMPPHRFVGREGTRDENVQEMAFRHVMCACFAPS